MSSFSVESVDTRGTASSTTDTTSESSHPLPPPPTEIHVSLNDDANSKNSNGNSSRNNKEDAFTHVHYTLEKKLHDVHHKQSVERTERGGVLFAEMLHENLVKKHGVIIVVRHLAEQLQAAAEQGATLQDHKVQTLGQVDLICDKTSKRYGYSFAVLGSGHIQHVQEVVRSFLHVRKRATLEALPAPQRDEVLQQTESGKYGSPSPDRTRPLSSQKPSSFSSADAAASRPKFPPAMLERQVIPSLAKRAQQTQETGRLPDLPTDEFDLLLHAQRLRQQVEQDDALIKRRREARKAKEAEDQAHKEEEEAKTKTKTSTTTTDTSVLTVRAPLVCVQAMQHVLIYQVFELEVV